MLEPAFLTLNEALAARSALLQNISKMPRPKTDEEVALLRKAALAYREIVENTKSSLAEMNAYIKSKK